MSGPFRAKLEGYFNTTTDLQNARAAFKFTWDHFKYLESVGVTTEIARNNGTGATTGSTGWWNKPNSFGADAWAVFRWNSSSVRTWEWYMLMQMASGSALGAGASPFQAEETGPITRNVGFAAAIGIEHLSGAYTFFNPWNGTTGSMDSDSKRQSCMGLDGFRPSKRQTSFNVTKIKC